MLDRDCVHGKDSINVRCFRKIDVDGELDLEAESA